MRVFTIAEIKALDPDDTIDSVVGRLTKIFPRKAGTNSRGEYALQNAELQDGTGTIKVQLKDREELPQSFKGKVVVIYCSQGNRGKTGVKRKIDDYKGASDPLVSVTATGQIELHQEDGTATQQPSAPPQQPTQAPQQKAAPAQQTNGNGNGVDVRKKLNRMANLYLECLKAGNYVASQFETAYGQPMEQDQYQACVSSLFIQATRENMHLHVSIGTFKD